MLHEQNVCKMYVYHPLRQLTLNRLQNSIDVAHTVVLVVVL